MGVKNLLKPKTNSFISNVNFLQAARCQYRPELLCNSDKRHLIGGKIFIRPSWKKIYCHEIQFGRPPAICLWRLARSVMYAYKVSLVLKVNHRHLIITIMNMIRNLSSEVHQTRIINSLSEQGTTKDMWWKCNLE